jgi:nicotinate-nucleotide adenylyltransferase
MLFSSGSSSHLSRIGLFGGTFDPIHLGHLILAEAAFEKLALDQLLFIPAHVSPYKTELPPAAPAADRLAMIELAIAGREGWSVDTRELFKRGPSFTIDTVRELQREKSNATFILLLGEDQLPGLPQWRESEELQKLVSFLIFARKPQGEIKQRAGSLPTGATFLDRSIDISATEIRERLAKNREIDYLVPTSIHDYIKKKKLYQIN